MKNRLITLVALLIGLACGTAQAQRRYLPVIDLVEVPVTLAATKSLTAAQVRSAIVGAALAAQWDVEPNADGSLTLSLWKDMEYRIVMRATYTDATYTLRYVSSENLKTIVPLEFGAPVADLRDNLNEYAKGWREKRGALLPESKFAVDRHSPYIHPTYELFVYELSSGVRRHLRLL